MPTADIFEFWAQMPLGGNIHPADKPIFDRLNPKSHGFQLDCLPASFTGPLRTAPVVLLYLSPGFRPQDATGALKREVQDYYFRRWQGEEPIPEDHAWAERRTKYFGSWSDLRHKIAVLNIVAYHSKTFNDYSVLASLPSSRVAIEWAQTHLFPEAEVGRRVVICLRASAFWGLERGRTYEGNLFAPGVTRAGFLVRNEARAKLIKLVKAVI